MSARSLGHLSAVLAIAIASVASAADAPSFRINETRGPVRPADMAPFKGDSSVEILAGPTNGLDSAFIVHQRLAPGARNTGLYSLPVEHTYLVLEGRLTVQIGSDEFVAEPDTLVLVPAGVPHRAWNAGSVPERDLQAIAPAPSRDLAAMMKPAQPRKIENAAQYVRVPPALTKLAGGQGHDSLNERILAEHSNGTKFLLERLNDVLPGGGRTEPHGHPFDQIYFVKKGTMTVEYGSFKYTAAANSLVVLPNGVVHSNQNLGSEPQSIVTLMLPQPPEGQGLGITFNITRNTTGGGARNRGSGGAAP